MNIAGRANFLQVFAQSLFLLDFESYLRTQKTPGDDITLILEIYVTFFITYDLLAFIYTASERSDDISGVSEGNSQNEIDDISTKTKNYLDRRLLCFIGPLTSDEKSFQIFSEVSLNLGIFNLMLITLVKIFNDK